MAMECGVDCQDCLAGFIQVMAAVVQVAESRGGLFGVDFQGEVKGIRFKGIMTARQTTYVQRQETSLSPKAECHRQRARPNPILVTILMTITPTRQTSTYMEISDENARFR
ncbi:uncharacterized protein LOC122359506 isoform X4 [Puntigrus tetrazona]|uniref:uncharacterized protein LOC122359506 isoform X4 n=1 Tax=Puntigrus tetrazona TaxID=1606681 RepID=UPI001C88F771|nr:uncharacterized protein LOC122359506 isoform X4 [Puntigrus tetrazona]